MPLPAVRALSLGLLVIVWSGLALALGPAHLPSPWAVVSRIGALAGTGELFRDIGVTLARVAVSFLVAMAIGTAAGLAMARAERLDSLLDPWLVIALNVPALVTIILCYIWFGLGELAAIVAVAANKIPTVVVTIREGGRAFDAGLIEVAEAFGISRRRRLTRIYLPQLYPFLMAAARSGLALIWKIVLVVELLGRSNGVGFRLGIYFQFFDITGILAYTAAFAAVVLTLESWVLRPLDRRANRWR